MRIPPMTALSSAPALALALAVGAAAPQGLKAETLTDALISAYQTSPQLDAGRAALRSLDESVPQARAQRRPQVSAALSAATEGAYDEWEERSIRFRRR